MAIDRAKATRVANLDSLLLEAGAVCAQHRNPAFRSHGAREAGRLYIPGADEVGAGRHFTARAIRDCLRALNSVSSDDAREHIAKAMRELIAAVRIEQPKPKRDADTSTPYWIER